MNYHPYELAALRRYRQETGTVRQVTAMQDNIWPITYVAEIAVSRDPPALVRVHAYTFDQLRAFLITEVKGFEHPPKPAGDNQ